MAANEYKRVLESASRLSENERARLIKELAERFVKSRRRPDLSRIEEAVAYVEGMRIAESRESSGRLRAPEEFLAELESWKE